MVSLVISAVILIIAIMMVISERQAVNDMKKRLKGAQEDTLKLEHKLENLRTESRKSKDDLERERTALRDARELAKKKLRRQASADIELEPAHEAAMTDRALDDNQKALNALEAQLEGLKREHAQSEDEIRAKLEGEASEKVKEKDKEILELKKKISDLQEEIKKQKRLLRPEGHKIDLKTLPDEAASEFSRVYRKAEQHERLHGIARAKLHLAQEKFAELQKRYFSVCRELALIAGQEGGSEAETKTGAEKIVIDDSDAPSSEERSSALDQPADAGEESTPKEG